MVNDVQNVDLTYKLIQYKYVVSRMIDGCATLINYLIFSNNNYAETGFSYFEEIFENIIFPLELEVIASQRTAQLLNL